MATSAHIVTQPAAPISLKGGAYSVHQVPALQDNFSWLIVEEATGKALAVDGPRADEILAKCAAEGWTLSGILTTHIHWDHIGLHKDLKRRGMLDGLRVYGAVATADAIPGLTDPLEDGDTVAFGALRFDVLQTEGHLNGHISFYGEGVLFCGDTLFAGGCGYMFHGPAEVFHASLTRLAALPPETQVCCAHEYTQDNLRFAWFVDGDNPALRARMRRVWTQRLAGEATVPSTIGDERATNPFLRVETPAIAECLAAQKPEMPRNNGAQAFAALRALKDGKPHRAAPEPELGL